MDTKDVSTETAVSRIALDYFAAIQIGDQAKFKSIASHKLLNRIDEHAQRQNPPLPNPIASFLADQKKKLDRLGATGLVWRVESVSLGEDHGQAYATVIVSLENKYFSKPIYHVKEGSEWKLSVIKFTEGNTYRVVNQHNVDHHITAKGGAEVNSPAGTDNTEIFGEDSDNCGVLDGTWFVAPHDPGRKVYCDYNTVGWDVKFNNLGQLECADDC